MLTSPYKPGRAVALLQLGEFTSAVFDITSPPAKLAVNFAFKLYHYRYYCLAFSGSGNTPQIRKSCVLLLNGDRLLVKNATRAGEMFAIGFSTSSVHGPR